MTALPATRANGAGGGTALVLDLIGPVVARTVMCAGPASPFPATSHWTQVASRWASTAALAPLPVDGDLDLAMTRSGAQAMPRDRQPTRGDDPPRACRSATGSGSAPSGPAERHPD